MKQPPIGGAAVKSYVGARDQQQSTAQNIVATHPKSKRIAKRMAELYETTTSGLELFISIYKSTALHLTGTERRELHREFRRLM